MKGVKTIIGVQLYFQVNFKFNSNELARQYWRESSEDIHLEDDAKRQEVPAKKEIFAVRTKSL